jgi:hypothetical protein
MPQGSYKWNTGITPPLPSIYVVVLTLATHDDPPPLQRGRTAPCP